MQTSGYEGWQLPLPSPPLTGICGVLLGSKMTNGVNVGKDVSVARRVDVGEDVSVIVEVDVIVWVSVLVGIGVGVNVAVSEGVIVAVGIEAIIDDAVALTDETTWAPINSKASTMPTALRESKDLLM